MYGILFKEKARGIIEILLSGEKSLTELSEKVELSKPTLQQKYLKDLELAGIVRKRTEKNHRGREVFYSLRRFSLFICIDPHDKKVISLSTDADYVMSSFLAEQVHGKDFKQEIKLIVERLSGMKRSYQPDYVILFGSLARGEGTWKSDIDLALLRTRWTDLMMEKVIDTLSDVTMGAEHQIKPYFFSMEEYRSGDNVMIKEIKENGLLIHGEIFNEDGIWQEMKRYGTITI